MVPFISVDTCASAWVRVFACQTLDVEARRVNYLIITFDFFYNS